MEILTYLQIENNEIADFSYDLVSYAKEISNGIKVSGIVVEFENLNIDYSNLSKFGLDKLYILKSNLPYFDKRRHSKLILEAVKKISPNFFILNSTTEGREIAPIVASSLNTGLTADCTKLEITDNKLLSTRPTFGGKLMATILSKKSPEMATLRKNTFKKKEFNDNGTLEIESLDFNTIEPLIEILDYKKENKNFYNLQNARIILAGGMGLKNKENFDKLKHLSNLINAKTGATRKATDKGFIEKEFQIGQTGITVTPEIYVAFGISGAIHHVVGMENSKKIIAVNIDKNAPIFNYSDFGIVDDAIKTIDYLINYFS